MTEKGEPRVPKRILHIGKYFPPHRGGMETVLRDQMNMQTRDEDLQVAAVVHSSERRFTDKIEIQPLGYRVRHAARWFTAVFAPISPFFAWSVYREIKQLDPDEIRVHMPNVSAFWLLFLPAARARKLVVLWHSDVLASSYSIGLRVFYRFYRPFENWLLGRASTIVASSNAYLESSIPLRRFRHKCRVEPLQIDIERIPKKFREAVQAPRRSDEGIRVLCVGRLTYYKDFGTVIRAVSAIENAQLHIVGEGDERKNLENIICNLSTTHRVKLLGELSDEDVWRQFIWCDVHVLPSIERTEAFGLVILEAATFGKPSLIADVPGSGMQSAADATGFERVMFSAGDCSSLRMKLERHRILKI